MTEQNLRIGAFSSLTRLSVRMLRYYDDHAILGPAEVDSYSGYRYYTLAQVKDAVFVRRLRDIGFSVSAIAALLPLRNDPDTLGRAFAVQRDHLLAEAAAAKRRFADLDQLVSTIKEATMATITTTTLSAQRVAALRMTIPNYWSEGAAWERLMAEASAQQLAFLPEPCGATFYDDGYQEADVDIEVWLPVSEDAVIAPPLVDAVLPERDVAVATVIGPYDLVGPACDQLGEYLSDYGLTPTGRMFNRYIVGPGRTRNPAEYVTEVCIPISEPG